MSVQHVIGTSKALARFLDTMGKRVLSEIIGILQPSYLAIIFVFFLVFAFHVSWIKTFNTNLQSLLNKTTVKHLWLRRVVQNISHRDYYIFYSIMQNYHLMDSIGITGNDSLNNKQLHYFRYWFYVFASVNSNILLNPISRLFYSIPAKRKWAPYYHKRMQAIGFGGLLETFYLKMLLISCVINKKTPIPSCSSLYRGILYWHHLHPHLNL